MLSRQNNFVSLFNFKLTSTEFYKLELDYRDMFNVRLYRLMFELISIFDITVVSIMYIIQIFYSLKKL